MVAQIMGKDLQAQPAEQDRRHLHSSKTFGWHRNCWSRSSECARVIRVWVGQAAFDGIFLLVSLTVMVHRFTKRRAAPIDQDLPVPGHTTLPCPVLSRAPPRLPRVVGKRKAGGSGLSGRSRPGEEVIAQPRALYWTAGYQCQISKQPGNRKVANKASLTKTFENHLATWTASLSASTGRKLAGSSNRPTVQPLCSRISRSGAIA